MEMGFGATALSFTLKTLHGLVWLRGSLGFLLTWLWTGLLYVIKHKGTKLECIQEDVRQLNKIPMHVALIVSEEQLSLYDLARMVVWSFSSGTHNISLYDPSGKSWNQNGLYDELGHHQLSIVVLP